MSTPSETQKLLTVEETFQLSGCRLITMTGLPRDHFGTQGRQYQCSVLIKRPDGSSIMADATFAVPSFKVRDMDTPGWPRIVANHYDCLFRGLTKADVPIGSEIYELKTD